MRTDQQPIASPNRQHMLPHRPLFLFQISNTHPTSPHKFDLFFLTVQVGLFQQRLGLYRRQDLPHLRHRLPELRG